MSTSLHPMLNIAIKAARAAGAIINRGSQDLDLLTISTKGPNDFVSEVDRAAEAAIIETILTAYPGHGILAEESGREHGAKHSDYMWIIDPLDGTTNFLHGFPVYCVSIALAFRGKVEQAVVYDPTRNDLFYASRGRGAYLNDRRLRVSRRTRLAESLIGTGFPFRRGDNFHRYVQMFETVMQNCAGLRRPGAAALDLCYVAAGWYDGFFETGLNPWDMAAGALMITEAGGLIGNFTGEADFLFQREVVAGNPKVYGQLVTLLAPHSRAIKAESAAEGEAAQAQDAGDVVAAVLAAAARADGADTATGEAAAEAAPPARERKPVRIRRAETAVEEGGDEVPAAASESGAALESAESASPTAPADGEPAAPPVRKVPTVTHKPPSGDGPRGPRHDGPRPRQARPDGAPPRGPRPDNGPPRGPRPDGGPPRGPRPEGGPPRGPRPDGAPPRGPRPDGDRQRPPRPEGDRPRGPRPDGGGPRGPSRGGPGSGPTGGRPPAKGPRGGKR